MSKTRYIVVLTLAFTVFGVALRTVISSPVNAASVLLPYHAVIQGNANPFPIDPCTLGNHETASGQALHLGKITWTSDEVAQFLSCPPPGPAIAVTGHFTIVAANGDEIHGTYQTRSVAHTHCFLLRAVSAMSLGAESSGRREQPPLRSTWSARWMAPSATRDDK